MLVLVMILDNMRARGSTAFYSYYYYYCYYYYYYYSP